MQEKTVIHERPGESLLKAVVSEATALQGMRRGILVSRGLIIIRKEHGLDEDEDEGLPDSLDLTARHFLRRYIYPNCLACLVEAEGFPADLTFEEFMEMPDVFVAQWESAALDLNEHWKLRTEEDEEAEAKKKEPSENG